MGRSKRHERLRTLEKRRQREWAPDNLRRLTSRLESTASGPLPVRTRRLVAGGLFRGWYALRGPGANRSWVLGQVDEIHWDPPFLTFQAWHRCGPRPGKWHDLQRWTVDLESRSRSITLVERKHYHWKEVIREFDPVLIGKELARMIRQGRRDPRLHWSTRGRARLQPRAVVPRLAPAIVTRHRARIERVMARALGRHGVRRGAGGWWGPQRLEPVRRKPTPAPIRRGVRKSSAKDQRVRARTRRGGVIGWREWTLRRDPYTDEMFLGSPDDRTLWEGPVVHSEMPFDPGLALSSKGITSWRPEHAEAHPLRLPIHGHVIVYGRVVAHERGFRSEHAIIRDLTLRVLIDPTVPVELPMGRDPLAGVLGPEEVPLDTLDLCTADQAAKALARRYHCDVAIQPLTRPELEAQCK
jgi:hypothetical protein